MADLAHTVDARERTRSRFALFDYGFRPFFLLAGLWAFLLVPIWLYFYAHHGASFGALPMMYWHAHEMIFGFVGAAIAGFLLTAVPSWTGARGYAGRPLYLLVGLWIAGRILMTAADAAPFPIVALGELAFLPALAALLAPALFRAANRNTPLLAVIGVLWLLDAAFLVAFKNGDAALASRAITLAIDFVLILVTIIGGRIVPAFTANALRRAGVAGEIVSRPWLEKGVIAAMIAVALVDAIAPHGMLSGALAALAAVVHAVRLSGWRSFRTRGEPILWVLHVGYAWLPIGFALKALWLLGQFTWAVKWQHALTAGVFATMILAVMTRASLGHTGRPLVVSRAITIAYLSLTAAVVVRVFAPLLMPERYLLGVTIAGIAWTLSFLIFLIVYAPILCGPRADGKPG